MIELLLFFGLLLPTESFSTESSSQTGSESSPSTPTDSETTETEPPTCPATEVANSDYASSGAITGQTGDDVIVTCDLGYSGGGTMICEYDVIPLTLIIIHIVSIYVKFSPHL